MGSDWKESNIKHRDSKQVKDNPEVKHPGKKNTKKWCKGRVGREHVVKTVPMAEVWTWISPTSQWNWGTIDICTVCKKQIKHNWNRQK